MEVLIMLVLILTSVLTSIWYLHFYKKRVLFTDRFGMTLALSSSIIISLVLTMNFAFLLPFSNTIVTIVSVIIGITIGLFFGAMVRYHSLLSGLFGGTMGSMMGAMLGAVVKNPALCGLPQTTGTAVQQGMVVFSVFSLIVFLLSMKLILYALEV